MRMSMKLGFSHVVKHICRGRCRRFISSNSRNSNGLNLSVYTSEQQSQIIETLHKCVMNNSTRIHLNKKRLESLRLVFERNPNMTSLEPLLSVNGFGPKLLHRICDSIIQLPETDPQSHVEKTESETTSVLSSADNVQDQEAVKMKLPSNLITPHKISQTELEAAVSIQLGINAISWARLRTSGAAEVDSWDTLDLSHCVDKKYDVHSTWELAMELRELIPNGDIYIMENKSWSNAANVKKPMKYHIQEAMLTTAICSVFNQSDQRHVPRPEPSNRVYFLRAFTSARLFRRMVGTERVSAQDIVQNMMLSVTDPSYRQVVFSEGAVNRYWSLSGSLRDNMCQALLLAVSFTELVLLQNHNALGVIRKASNGKRNSTS